MASTSAQTTSGPLPSSATPAHAGLVEGSAGSTGNGASKQVLFDLASLPLDFSRPKLTKKQLERWIPHRDQMALLDGIVWHSDDFKRGVAVKHMRGDEFWVAGHFPGKPMFPGVLMIESGAQLASFLYNARFPEPKIAAFIRLEDATFRASVTVGDEFVLLCQEVKFSPKRFSSDIQGLVGDKIAFTARITGMAI